jgi:G3E family GTPase
MSEVNIDASLVQGEVSFNRAEEKLVEMSNGCICCTLREDLLIEVTQLAKSGRFDYLLIESTGISEPMPVAETFTFEDEQGVSLSQVARLDTLVTVVDSVNFRRDFAEAKSLQEAGESLGEDDVRSVADLLIEQVEFANVILMSKTDLISAEQVTQLRLILQQLNPSAHIYAMQQGHIDLTRVLNTGLFDILQAQDAPGWLQEPRGTHTPETEEYGIGSFSYHARKPFHPQKFWNFLHQDWPRGKLIRCKGYFWLASQPQMAGVWNQAGGIAHHSWAGMFWKAVTEDKWPDDAESKAFIATKWVEPFGDMRQELVFIGQGLDENSTKVALDDCLLSDEELLAGVEYWIQLTDPFAD